MLAMLLSVVLGLVQSDLIWTVPPSMDLIWTSPLGDLIWQGPLG